MTKQKRKKPIKRKQTPIPKKAEIVFCVHNGIYRSCEARKIFGIKGLNTINQWMMEYRRNDKKWLEEARFWIDVNAEKWRAKHETHQMRKERKKVTKENRLEFFDDSFTQELASCIEDNDLFKQKCQEFGLEDTQNLRDILRAEHPLPDVTIETPLPTQQEDIPAKHREENETSFVIKPEEGRTEVHPPNYDGPVFADKKISVNDDDTADAETTEVAVQKPEPASLFEGFRQWLADIKRKIFENSKIAK